MVEPLHQPYGAEQIAKAEPSAVALGGMQNLGRQAGNDGDGDNQTETHGATDGNGNVAEELSGLLFDEYDGHENRDRGQRAGQHGPPYLARAVVGGLSAGLPHLAMPVDVLEHDDGIVDDHADRERHPGQADDVERAVKPVHHQERRHDADGDGNGDDKRAGETSQEQQQHEDRQRAADE